MYENDMKIEYIVWFIGLLSGSMPWLRISGRRLRKEFDGDRLYGLECKKYIASVVRDNLMWKRVILWELT